MAWIKRNLYFLVGTAVAVAMLGLAGYYCYSKWSLNNDNDAKLTAAYEDWKRIINQPIGPGNEKVNNIELARAEQEKVRQMAQKLRAHFVRIPPIPNPTNGTFTGFDFYSALGRTISQLTREAANAGVKIQTNYSFSFEAERQQVNYEPGSLGPLSERLGHVKFICDVLFKAKVNSLLGIRRERVSLYDAQSVTDYLDIPSVTNDLAVLVPYEVKFECFSAELGEVLAGFANLANGVIVKAINVERSSEVPAVAFPNAQATPAPAYQYQIVQPQFAGQTPPREYRGPGSAYDPYGRAMQQRGMMPPPNYPPTVYPPPVQPGYNPALPPGARPSNNVLEERPLTVTLVVNVVKLLPRR